MSTPHVVLAADHAGFTLKNLLKADLDGKGFQTIDLGPACAESCDYPVKARDCCKKVLELEKQGVAAFGVLVCGTGMGMSMAANRIPGIRAALCGNEFLARMARQHNNANVLCLGERVLGAGLALAVAQTFLAEPFEGGRHQRRIDLFDQDSIPGCPTSA